MNVRMGMIGLLALLGACAHTADTAGEASAADGLRVVSAADLQWGHLNPARGDASPRAANLWGDRSKDEATGFLVRFAPGFSSPAHIHNVSYRAVVIEGSVHNDDPNAAHQWMGPGSFWTQPAGESHITAAASDYNLALVEIDSGPYLVHPEQQAFDNGEQPLNLAADNIVWLPAPGQETPGQEKGNQDNSGVEIAYLWGRFESSAPHEKRSWNGSFLKLPAGFHGRIQSAAPSLHAVVISGQITQGKDERLLTPGSYFGLDKPAAPTKLQYTVANTHSEAAVLYLRTTGPYQLIGEDK